MTSTPDQSHGWLLLLYTLTAQQAAARLSLWRKLKKIGAHLLRTSAYVLPDEPIYLEQFQWIAQQVRDHGGEATLARVTRIEGVSNDDLARRFNEDRAAEYAVVAKSLRDQIAAHRRKANAAFSTAVDRLRRQFNEICSIDSFDCPMAHDVEMLFRRAGRLSEPRVKSATILDARRFRGRSWLTRPHPEIDRVGSAWLIRKFIDRRANFIFATSPAAHPKALPYDMADVEFTHHGDDCTFETLLKRFALSDPVARRMAEMIHDADLEDGKFQRPECLGLDLLFKGWSRLGLSDAEILEKGFACFDALYAAMKKRT